jgi:hypothetical protein
LIAFGKANPDKSNYPTSSPAFTIASELFKLKTAMPGQPIPYRSTNEMVLSVVGGQTLFAFPDSGVVVPMAQGGKVRALAVGAANRIPELPETPTLAEAGHGDVELKTQWIGRSWFPARRRRSLKNSKRHCAKRSATQASASASAASPTFRRAAPPANSASGSTATSRHFPTW